MTVEAALNRDIRRGQKLWPNALRCAFLLTCVALQDKIKMIAGFRDSGEAMDMSQKPLACFHQFSPLLIIELRHLLGEFNAGRLDAKAALRAWQKVLDEEIEDVAFRSFAVEQFGPIMATIAQGEDDLMLIRDVTGQVFLRLGGEGVEVPQ